MRLYTYPDVYQTTQSHCGHGWHLHTMSASVCIPTVAHLASHDYLKIINDYCRNKEWATEICLFVFSTPFQYLLLRHVHQIQTLYTHSRLALLSLVRAHPCNAQKRTRCGTGTLRIAWILNRHSQC